MGSSQSTEHDIPKKAYERAKEKSFERNSNNTECKTQIYPNLHKPTMTCNNVEPTNKNISDVTHYPQVFKYSYNKEELVNHTQKKELNNGYAHHQQNSSEFASSSKEKPVKQLNVNQEKVYNGFYTHIKETPSAPVRNDLLLESMYKPPPDIKNLKEFIKNWNIWKEEMRSFLILVDYNKKDYYKWGTFVLNRMGSTSHEILQHLIFDKEDDRNNFSILIEKFDAYHKFVTNAKSENESVINYVERLKVDCIKNIKNVDNMIKQKLEKEIEKLCKERFIAIASSKMPDFKFEKTFKSLTIAEIAFLWNLCDNSIWEENKICKYCGKLHPKDRCFAFGKECNKCKRRNHFSKYCPGVMYINNCSFCGGDHGVKKCLAYDEKCSKCNKLHHFSWMCSKITMLRNCKFCGLAHVMDRSKCPALKSLCSICRTTGHYDIKCPNSNV